MKNDLLTYKIVRKKGRVGQQFGLHTPNMEGVRTCLSDPQIYSGYGRFFMSSSSEDGSSIGKNF